MVRTNHTWTRKGNGSDLENMAKTSFLTKLLKQKKMRQCIQKSASLFLCTRNRLTGCKEKPESKTMVGSMRTFRDRRSD